MPLFEISGNQLSLVRPSQFDKEKILQTLIEQNLETVFSCRLIASEFSTGPQHAGRIDTLAISEDDNPTIIEYKKVASSELITQSLFYLNWLHDHRGDFEIAAQSALGLEINVDWSSIRVICIAPEYRKYDLHAVHHMGANIELWKYRLFANNCLLLEDVFTPTQQATHTKPPRERDTDSSPVYTWEYHKGKGSPTTCAIAQRVRDACQELSESVEEAFLKNYVAYRLAKNFCCMEIQKKKVLLFLRLNPADCQSLPPNARDVSRIGHFGTGDLELTLCHEDDIDKALPLIRAAFEAVGGA